MIAELALAASLQAELGANAPDSTKPCADHRPKKIKNARPRPKPKVGLVQKHFKAKPKPKLAAEEVPCDYPIVPGPLAFMFPPIENLEYSPAPEQETFAADSAAMGREELADNPGQGLSLAVGMSESLSESAAFTYASFGGGGTFGGYSAIGGPCCQPCEPIQGFAQPVPEPSTWAFLGLGLLSLAGLGRKK